MKIDSRTLRRSGVWLGVLLAPFMVCGLASAVGQSNHWSYTALGCKESRDRTPELIYGAGHVANTSGATELRCPITRPFGDTNNLIDDVWAHGTNPNGDNTTCWIAACDFMATTCAFTTSVSGGTSFFTEYSLGSIQAFRNGSVFIGCSMPGANSSGIGPGLTGYVARSN